MSEELPKGWITRTIREITTKVGSGATPSGGSASYFTRGTPLIRSMNIHFTGFDQSGLAFINDEQARALDNVFVEFGDVLLNITGASIGRVCTAPSGMHGARVNQHVCIIRTTEAISSEFLRWFLASPEQQKMIMDTEAGATRQALTKAKILDFQIPLPPLGEQRRIVAKLEALLAKVDASRKRLERIPTILKRFRQAVLAAACDGRLTEDWRAVHEGIEPASKVLNRFRTPNPEPFLNTFEDTSTSVLPDTWSWVPLGRLGHTMGGGTPSKENAEFWSGSIPWVSPKDMKRDHIDDSQDHISETALERSPVNQIPKGSILFVIRGMILNHTLPVAITDAVVTINQDMKALVPELPEISEYLFLAAKYLAPAVLFQVKEASHPYRLIETLARACPECVSTEILSKDLSGSRLDGDTTARQAKTRALKAIRQSMADAGRSFDGDPIISGPTGSYRCALPAYVL